MKTINELAQKAAAYRIGGQHMVDAIHGILDQLIKLLPNEMEFKHGKIMFTTNLEDSNIGSYGPAICHYTTDQWHENAGTTIDACPVDTEWNNAGDEYYLHGDFNRVINNATRRQIKEVAQRLPKFLEALESYLAKEAQDGNTATEQLKAMLSAL